MSITSKLSKFVVDTKFEDLPDEIEERLKMAVLDSLGCIVLGSTTDSGRTLIEAFGQSSTEETSTIVGTAKRAPYPYAALVNGTMGHRFDFDDGISAACGVHPGISIVPAALAIGERENASGKQLVAAVGIGYEVAARVGRSIRSRDIYLRGIHAQGMLGSFGAVAATAKLLGLDERSTINAIAVCASLVPVAPFASFPRGAMVKDMYAGWPSFLGVISALIAAKGFTGEEHILEDRLGLINAVVGEFDKEEILENLGSDYVWTERHYFKPYSACRLVHNPVDCVLELKRKHKIDLDNIERIVVITSDVAWTLLSGGSRPTNDIQARASMHYAVAAALVCDALGVDAFSTARLKDAEILKLAEKVQIRTNPDVAKAYPRRPIEVIVQLNDGRVYTAAREKERSLSNEETVAKFKDLSSRVLPAEQVTRIIALAENLDDLESICELTEELTSKPAKD